MKKLFPEYYQYTDVELENIWKNCTFVIDTNVLLNLYRYSKETSNELLKILDFLKSRIWIPHQAALEYHKRRLNIISEQRDSYKEVKKYLDDHIEQISEKLISSRHPFIENSSSLLDDLKKIAEKISSSLDNERDKCLNIHHEDHILEEITNLFEGRTGENFSNDQLEEICKLGAERYDQKIPPGYMDKDKNDNSFGDLIIWKQIMQQAKTTNKSIVFITDDKKEDWWLKFNGKIIGPRPELKREILQVAKVQFHMYRTAPFMEHAQKYLKQQITRKAINEVKETRKNDAKRQELLDANKIDKEKSWHLNHGFHTISHNLPDELPDRIDAFFSPPISVLRNNLYKLEMELRIIEDKLKIHYKKLDNFILLKRDKKNNKATNDLKEFIYLLERDREEIINKINKIEELIKLQHNENYGIQDGDLM